MKKETSHYHNKIVLKNAHVGNNTQISVVTVYNDKYGKSEFPLIDNELLLKIAENTVRYCINDNHNTTVLIKDVYVTRDDQLKIVAVLIHDRKLKDKIDSYV